MSRPWRRLGTLLALVVAGSVATGLLAAAPAQAHAVLVTSDPVDGAVRDAPPAEVVLRFNEAVELPPEPVRVFDSDGARTDTGEAGYGADHSVVRASLPPDLPDGVYVVAWRVISADTHPVRGSFVFTVGDPAGVDPGTVAVPEDDADLAWQVAAGLARWLTYGGTLLAAGGAAFLVVATGLASGERRRPVRVIGAGVVAGLAGTVVGVPLQAVLTSGSGAAALVDEALLADLVASSYGASALVRLAGLTVLVVGVAALGVLRWAPPVVLGGGAAALGSFLLAGHTVTSEPRALVVLSTFLHTAAAAVWFGGLVLLGLLLHVRRRAGGGAAGGARLVTRFSALAVGSVLVVAAAGVVLGWAEVRSWAGLFSTGYGWTLLAKAGLVAVVVAIGGYNNRTLVPAIRRGAGDAWRRLHRTVRVEAAVILVGVLAVTAVLVALPPGRLQVHAGATVAAGPYDDLHPLGPDHQVRLVVDPAAVGTNDLTVYLLDAAGEPAELGDQVELRFSLPDADIDRITREPEPAGPGTWHHSGPELSIAGTWQVEVRVQVGDFQRLTASADVPVAPAGDPAHHHP